MSLNNSLEGQLYVFDDLSKSWILTFAVLTKSTFILYDSSTKKTIFRTLKNNNIEEANRSKYGSNMRYGVFGFGVFLKGENFVKFCARTEDEAVEWVHCINNPKKISNIRRKIWKRIKKKSIGKGSFNEKMNRLDSMNRSNFEMESVESFKKRLMKSEGVIKDSRVEMGKLKVRNRWLLERLKLSKLDVSTIMKDVDYEKKKGGMIITLGTGAYGTVVKIKLGKFYAFKAVKDEVLSSEEKKYVVKYLEEEVKTMMDLNHENIIKVIGFSTYVEYEKDTTIKKNRVGIITELGKFPVSRMIHLSRRTKIDIPFKLKLKLLYHVCSAMKYLHHPEISMMHRDLKWENVLVLDSSGRIVVIDFGASKEFKSRIVKTHTYRRGSPWFIAPEISLKEESKTRYNEKCDIFSFAIMMCQLMYGLQVRDFEKYFYKDHLEFKKNPSLRPKINDIPNFFSKGGKEEINDRDKEEMMKIMKRCWSGKSSERPSFHILTIFFGKKLKKYCDGDLGDYKNVLGFYNQLISENEKNK